MPYEEHEQKSGNQKNQAVPQHLVLRFKVWIDGTQQTDSPTPASQCNENIFRCKQKIVLKSITPKKCDLK